MPTLLLYAPAMGHTRPRHPENHERLAGLLPFFEDQGVLADMKMIDPLPAAVSQLRRVHTLGLVESVRRASLKGVDRLDADTYVTGRSFDLALQAVGACCTAVDRLFLGQARNGMALVRPPGHHAQRDRVGGFCLFNNIAVAARQAQTLHDVQRVLIVDVDVHHGNGTQDIFYDDESVLFVSLHLFHPFFYPGTGAIDETGTGKGRGATLNIPFPPHVGDQGYGRAFAKVIVPRARRFRPELILVSIGFDAHWQDPLASADLSLTGYAAISRLLVDLAGELCDGRILFILEGGYFREALQSGLLNVAYALTGRDLIADPLGPTSDAEQDVTALIERLQDLHLLI